MLQCNVFGMMIDVAVQRFYKEIIIIVNDKYYSLIIKNLAAMASFILSEDDFFKELNLWKDNNNFFSEVRNHTYFVTRNTF